MTNLAQSIAVEGGDHHEDAASDTQLLKLKGNTPVTVYVRVEGDKVGLSLDQQTWYAKGMTWKHGKEYALYITYSLVTSGIELHPSKKGAQLWFSPVVSETQQQGCIPPVSGTYHFRIKVPGTAGTPDHYIDPQIVVTPL